VFFPKPREKAELCIDRDSEALIAIEKAIDLKPDVDEYWSTKGHVLSGLGRHLDALKAVQNAIKINGNDSTNWHLFGYVNLKLNQVEDAEHAFKIALAINPHDEKAKQGLSICNSRTRKR
jgi:tetratricopeptide (TPR) repeat protein